MPKIAAANKGEKVDFTPEEQAILKNAAAAGAKFEAMSAIFGDKVKAALATQINNAKLMQAAGKYAESDIEEVALGGPKLPKKIKAAIKAVIERNNMSAIDAEHFYKNVEFSYNNHIKSSDNSINMIKEHIDIFADCVEKYGLNYENEYMKAIATEYELPYQSELAGDKKQKMSKKDRIISRQIKPNGHYLVPSNNDNPITPNNDNPITPNNDNPITPNNDNPITPNNDNPITPNNDNPITPNNDNPITPNNDNPITPNNDNPPICYGTFNYEATPIWQSNPGEINSIVQWLSDNPNKGIQYTISPFSDDFASEYIQVDAGDNLDNIITGTTGLTFRARTQIRINLTRSEIFAEAARQGISIDNERVTFTIGRFAKNSPSQANSFNLKR